MEKISTILLILFLAACESTSRDTKKVTDWPVSDAPDFAVVLLPDTQRYAQYPEFGVYRHQTEWIVENQAALNIQAVIHLGDVTQQNLPEQWQVADNAHAVLDEASIPYSMAVGNHDYYPADVVYQRRSLFSDYFGADHPRFRNADWYGGSFSPKNENNYIFFEVGDLKFMILSLEFLPRKDVISWADRLISEHPNRRIIISTHAHLFKDGNYSDRLRVQFGMTGQEGVDLWDRLISRHRNVFMVVCGHYVGSFHRISHGIFGNPIYEILTDFQNEKVLKNKGGALGNGWLKVLHFKPSLNSIEIRCLTVESGNPRIFNNGAPLLHNRYYVHLNQKIPYIMGDSDGL